MWWELLSDEILFIARHLLRVLTISFGSIGFVYIFHRQLEINMGYKATNILSIISAIGLSYFSIIIYDMDRLVSPLELYWRVIIYTLLSSIIFVTVGWNLYDRVDNFLDEKFAPNEKLKRKRK